MQEENNNEAGSSRSLNWWLRFIAAAVILFAALIALYAYMFIYGGWGMITSTFTPETEQENIITTFPNLQGGLFLSAISETAEGATSFVPVLVLPNTHDFIYIPVDQLESGSVFSLQHAFSSDLTKLAFLGWPLIEDLTNQTPAIYRADVGGETAGFNEFIQNIQSTATLVLEPDAEDYFRQGPAISSMGDILYSSLPEAGFDSEPSAYSSIEAEQWTIYRLNSDNERQALTSGLAPKWIDETRFAFLKNDGIYMYNMGTSEEKLMWSLSFVPTLTNAFDVSDDGQLLAISNHEAGVVTIFKNNGLEGETPVEILSEVSAKVAGLTFAADNSYLAMLLLVGSNEMGTEGFARLTYYSIGNREFNDSYVDLEDPKLQGLYITDWK